MGIDANAIVFGNRTMEELAAGLRASGIAERVEVLHGDGDLTLGQLVVVPKGKTGSRVIWVFGNNLTDHRDVYAGERIVLNVGHHDDGGKLLEAVTRPFGGYVLDDDRTKDWRPVASVDTEFSARDRLHIEVAKLVGPTRAELLMPIIEDDDRREALIAAIRDVHPEPSAAPKF